MIDCPRPTYATRSRLSTRGQCAYTQPLSPRAVEHLLLNQVGLDLCSPVSFVQSLSRRVLVVGIEVWQRLGSAVQGLYQPATLSSHVCDCVACGDASRSELSGGALHIGRLEGADQAMLQAP